jgi:hypothetical protein
MIVILCWEEKSQSYKVSELQSIFDIPQNSDISKMEGKPWY